jgi:hypothetical protein
LVFGVSLFLYIGGGFDERKILVYVGRQADSAQE